MELLASNIGWLTAGSAGKHGGGQSGPATRSDDIPEGGVEWRGLRSPLPGKGTKEADNVRTGLVFQKVKGQTQN